MKKLIIFEYIVFISIILLITLIATWNAIISPSENIPRIIPTIFYNIPLLYLMVKLRNNKFNTYIFTSYLMLLYFLVGIGNLVDKETFIVGTIISFLSITAFISSILYVREKNKISVNNID